MTPEQIALVQDSFDKVAPISDVAAGLFYARLFELSPEVRPMFRSDMDEQGRKLMVTLGVVANGLNNLDRIVPVAEELARRHVPLGVQPDHYGPVGQALLDTLEKGLGAEFTAETRAAWTEAYGLLSGVMIAAAYPDEESAT